MNSFYGVQIRRDNNESYKCKSETCIETEFDEKVLEYWKKPNGKYIVKMKKDDGLDDDCDIKNTLPAVLAAFILANSRRIMNKFTREISGFYKNNINYTDTDSLYLVKKYWDVLDKANLYELATNNRIYVNNVNFHEIKSEILQDYTGDFDLNAKMIIGAIEHKTIVSFENMGDFENYINTIDVD